MPRMVTGRASCISRRPATPISGPGSSGTTCTVNDLLLSPNMSVRLNVQGFTHIAYIQETAAAKINITPLEAG